MASLDLDDLPPKIARMILGLADGEQLLLLQNGAVMGRLLAQTKAPPAAADAAPVEAAEAAPAVEKPPEPPPEPISSPVTEQKARDIFEQFRAAIEDEF